MAERFSQLHGLAIQEFARTTAGDGPRKRAVVVLGIHSHNIYTTALDLVIRGLFDVAAYLHRPLFDTPALILLAGKYEEHAKRVLPGGTELRPSEARKLVEADPELAEAFSQDAGVYSHMNQYSHVNPYHVESVLDLTDDGVFPTIGGRRDRLRAQRDTAILCRLEMGILAALGKQLPTDSSERWWTDLGPCVLYCNDWFKVVSADVAERNARIEQASS